MNDQPVIRTRGLTRYFGGKPAVEGLNLDVPRGSVFAFLGRNGSGKTTTIRMLLGLLQPTRGQGVILGHDIRNLPTEARARIGYLTEEHQLYGWMSVKECSDFQSRFYPRWNEKIFRGVVGHFNLRMSSRVKDLSRGERAQLTVSGGDAGNWGWESTGLPLDLGLANSFSLSGTLVLPSARLVGDAITDLASRPTVRPRTTRAGASSAAPERRMEPLPAQS